MGIGTYAFVKGFTGDVRDSIDKREESERDRKKSIFLEGLRRDTYKWQKDLDETYALSNPDKNMEEIDYVKGVKVLKNKKGDVLRETPLTQSDREAYDIDVRGKRAGLTSLETKAKYADEEARLGMDRDRAAIAASHASTDNARSGASLNRAQAKALDKTAGGGGSIDDRALELLYVNKAVQDDLIRSGVPAEAVTDLAVQTIANVAARKQPASAAQQTFLQAAALLRAKAKDANFNTKPPR